MAKRPSKRKILRSKESLPEKPRVRKKGKLWKVPLSCQGTRTGRLVSDGKDIVQEKGGHSSPDPRTVLPGRRRSPSTTVSAGGGVPTPGSARGPAGQYLSLAEGHRLVGVHGQPHLSQVLPHRLGVVPGMSDVGATGREKGRDVAGRPGRASPASRTPVPHHSIRGAAFRRAFRFSRFRLTL